MLYIISCLYNAVTGTHDSVRVLRNNMSARIPHVNLAGADSSMVRYVIHAGVPYSCQGALTCKKNHASPRDPNLYTTKSKFSSQMLESNGHIPYDNATHVESGKSQLQKRKFILWRL